MIECSHSGAYLTAPKIVQPADNVMYHMLKCSQAALKMLKNGSQINSLYIYLTFFLKSFCCNSALL